VFPGEGGFKKNPAVSSSGVLYGRPSCQSEGNRSCFYLGMNRSRCQKPPVIADGGSRRSYSPAAVLPQPGVPVDILDLRVLRSRAAVLHGSVSRPSAASAAARGQPASSAERRGAAGSSRPSEAVSPPSQKKRDGSWFSIGFISFTIGVWKSDHDAGGGSVACPAE